MKPVIKFKRKQLIEFFDVRVKHKEDEGGDTDGRGADVSAITALWGEDIIFGLLHHFWLHQENCKSTILSYSVKTGKKKGPKLDGWILKDKERLFQAEVKNWSASSIDGETLEFSASPEILREFSRGWQDWFENGFLRSKAAKVMKTMSKPEHCKNSRATPLFCMWPYMVGRHGKPYCVFSFSDGREVHVFSASAYLRLLTEQNIEIEMPRARRRFALMKRMAFLPN